MAIVKMKKLQLMVIRAQKEALLQDLQLLGCVSVIEPETPELQLKRDAGGVTEAPPTPNSRAPSPCWTNTRP